MKWCDPKNKHPSDTGSYFARDHCGFKFIASYADLAPVHRWMQQLENGHWKDICPHCYNFEWLDEDDNGID